MYIDPTYAVVFVLIGAWAGFANARAGAVGSSAPVSIMAVGASLIYTLFSYGFGYTLLTGVELFLGTFIGFALSGARHHY